MVRGLYTAAMGMMTSQAQVDVISQNLANVNTPGYCQDEALELSFPQDDAVAPGQQRRYCCRTDGNR